MDPMAAFVCLLYSVRHRAKGQTRRANAQTGTSNTQHEEPPQHIDTPRSALEIFVVLSPCFLVTRLPAPGACQRPLLSLPLPS